MNTEYESLWDAVDGRITQGIETHRKSEAALRVEDASGRPLSGVDISLEQTSSAFFFGANAFMLGGYATPELNARYEANFLSLFNSATVPLYWRGLEPEPDNLRFAEGSRPIARRPPPDCVVAFAHQHGLSIVGHPLVWDFIKWSTPDWLPEDPAASAPLWEKRIAQIAERYGGQIPRWDVVNEVVTSAERVARGISRRMPDNYARLAFQWAQKYLPPTATLMINETTGAWRGDRAKYIALIDALLADGARIGAIGLQFHLFSDAENQQAIRGEIFRPADLLTTLDAMLPFARPVHISEITLTSLADDAAGRAAQATVAANFYRLWFSHPAVHAITWWNVPDGGAAPGEDKVSSGLLDRNLQPKPAYQTLHDLIKTQWRTALRASTNAQGLVNFRGFHGHYRARVQQGTSTVEFDLLPQGSNAATLRLS